MSAFKWSLQNDIFVFLKRFPCTDNNNITYESFKDHWQQMGMDLLCIVSDSASVISALINYGLFAVTRPFPDHQLLIYFLFSLFKASRKPIELPPEGLKLLMNIKLRAKILNDEATGQALRALFKNDAFILVAATQSFASASQNNFLSPSTANLTCEQLRERISRVESFILAHPLLNQKLSKATFTRLKDLLNRYSQAASSSSNLESIMTSVIKVIELYERSIDKFNFFALQPGRSVRSRLIKSSLTPIIPSSQPTDIFFSRSQSVPLVNSASLQKSRKNSTTSGLRDTAVDQFIGGPSNMPNIDNIHFY